MCVKQRAITSERVASSEKWPQYQCPAFEKPLRQPWLLQFSTASGRSLNHGRFMAWARAPNPRLLRAPRALVKGRSLETRPAEQYR